jgi:flagellar M-ring protein FliF
MVSSQRTEDASGGATSTGVPGTASNLPRPTSRPGSGASQTSRVTENVTYQSSRTVKKTRLPAGGVRKMSVAVLLDQTVSWQKDKTGFHRVLAPPSADKLKVVHDLVAGVTGLNEQRGDQLVVETQPFETTLELGPPDAPGAAAPKPGAPAGWPLQLNQKTLLIAGGGLVLLLVVAVVLALLLRRNPAARRPAPPAGPTELPAAPPGPLSLDQQLEARLSERDALQQQMDAKALSALKLAPTITKTAEVMAKHIREKVKQEPEVSAQVLRSWIRDEEAER